MLTGVSFSFAGSDTTATAIRCAIYQLTRNPQFKAKLFEEIDNAKLSPMISYAEAIKLPYLAAVIKESLRVHPSISLTFPRHVPKGGATISGRYFPEGCRVGVNPYVLHYQTSVFGDDAEDFNPERWFRPDAELMERTLFQFGAGSRTCIGKSIALMEIYKFVPQFFRAFDTAQVDPAAVWRERNTWFVIQEMPDFRLSRRVVQ